jgi:hypothetical protein
MAYEIIFALFIFICRPGISSAQFFDNLLQKGVDFLSKDKSQIWEGLSEDSIISSLKEALQLGLGTAVDYSSKADGYMGNPQMKTPMPERNQNLADMLKNIDLQKPVDDFFLSMN